MKRRNVLDGKPRRPVKRQTKIGDNFYGSTLVYVKLLLLWALVLLADHFLEFRFEYLWPFWLFLRSVYDSFKYQGLAFSVFFVCIALTSDMICYLFIPVHWLFFAASTYVWVQYVWHTEKGICLPTVFLWLLFVYIEASIRLKEFKAQLDLRNLPFHMDLCRPFAAHCIGYPVVTLGFGFKTYVSYRMRRRRQKEVQKVNEYYYEFLREALPPGPVREEAFNPHPTSPCIESDRISENGSAVISPEGGAMPHPGLSGASALVAPLAAAASANGAAGGGGGSSSSLPSSEHHHHPSPASLTSNGQAALVPSSSSSLSSTGAVLNGGGGGLGSLHGSPVMGGKHLNDNDPGAAAGAADCGHMRNGGVANGDAELMMDHGHDGHAHHGGAGGGGGEGKGKRGKGLASRDQRDASRGQKATSSGATSSGAGGDGSAVTTRGGKTLTKEEQVVKLEGDVKRLKIDLQISRNKENELRDQIVSYSSSERILKSEISNLQVEKSVLEGKISTLVSTRAGEKATLSSLEKKLADERKQKADYQLKLESERKSKKEQANAERAAHANQTRYEVGKLEREIAGLRADLQASEERRKLAEVEAYKLKKVASELGDPRSLSLDLEMAKRQKQQIEKSLSSEVKLKMDLFSALGEAKRTIGDHKHELLMKDKEIEGLRRRISDLVSVTCVTNGSGRGGSGGAGAVGVGRSLGVSSVLNGVNGDSSSGGGGGSGGSGGGLGGLGYAPTAQSLDQPIATELSSFNGQSRRNDKGDGGGGGAGKGMANGRNGSGGGGGSGLGLVNLEDQLMTRMVTGADAGVVNSVFTSSAFRSSNE